MMKQIALTMVLCLCAVTVHAGGVWQSLFGATSAPVLAPTQPSEAPAAPTPPAAQQPATTAPATTAPAQPAATAPTTTTQPSVAPATTAPAATTPAATTPAATAPAATTQTGAVVIPATQTVIGSREFALLPGITSITIHDGVTEIRDFAFNGCTGITSITIPASVTRLSGNAFTNWTAGQTIYVPFAQYQAPPQWGNNWDNIHDARIVYQDGVVETKEDRTMRANLQYISNGNGYTVRAGKVTGGSVVIPDTSGRGGEHITTIDRYAFQNLPGITSITIPAGVTTIGVGAFRGCTGITSITIPASVTTIGDGAFDGCTGLKSVTIGAGVTSIGASAFRGCTGITRIVIPASVKTVGADAFSGWTASQTINVSSEAISGGGWHRRWQLGCNAEIEYTGLGS